MANPVRRSIPTAHKRFKKKICLNVGLYCICIDICTNQMNMQTKHPPHIVPYYCHMTDRDGFAIIDEYGFYTGEFYPTYAAAVYDLLNYITN